MEQLREKRILLGVTGGIAAYKSAELVRLLRKAGAEVRVMMTRAAEQFVGTLTFETLSGHPVTTGMFTERKEAAMAHIELARWADAVLLAPATAHTMARLAQGLADDVVTTVCLASEAPLALAPAMNRQMWNHPATQANSALLRERGVFLFGPAEGEQACGDEGPGRMLEPEELMQELATLFVSPFLEGVRVMVTAGPTFEDIDPVRFLGNRSSGKMGYAMAEAAKRAGAEVTLISGVTQLPSPSGIECVRVRSALEMHAAVMQRVSTCDIFVAAAAVADYRPSRPLAQKIKKDDDCIQLELERNPDILADVSALPNGPFCVGFAAETERVVEYARAKLDAKGLEMIAANRVGGKEGGFESDRNALEVLWPGGGTTLPLASKTVIAQRLMELIGRRYLSASGK